MGIACTTYGLDLHVLWHHTLTVQCSTRRILSVIIVILDLEFHVAQFNRIMYLVNSHYLNVYLQTESFVFVKADLQYHFVAYDKLTTGQQHELFLANQTYNSLIDCHAVGPKSCCRPVISFLYATKSYHVNRPLHLSQRACLQKSENTYSKYSSRQFPVLSET